MNHFPYSHTLKCKFHIYGNFEQVKFAFAKQISITYFPAPAFCCAHATGYIILYYPTSQFSRRQIEDFFFLYFSHKIGLNISCKSSPSETICMKRKAPFLGQNKWAISKCRLLKFLPNMLSVYVFEAHQHSLLSWYCLQFYVSKQLTGTQIDSFSFRTSNQWQHLK